MKTVDAVSEPGLKSDRRNLFFTGKKEIMNDYQYALSNIKFPDNGLSTSKLVENMHTQLGVESSNEAYDEEDIRRFIISSISKGVLSLTSNFMVKKKLNIELPKQ